MPRRLLFFPDYSADPVWDLESGVMVDLDSLPIPPAVKLEVRAWASDWERLAWQSMRAVDVALGEVDGPAEPVSEAEDAACIERGQVAWQQLRTALAPDIPVGWTVFGPEGRTVRWDPDGPLERADP